MQESSNRTRRTFIESAGASRHRRMRRSDGSDSSTEDGSGRDSSDRESSDGATTGTGSETMADETVFFNAGSRRIRLQNQANIRTLRGGDRYLRGVNEVPWSNPDQTDDDLAEPGQHRRRVQRPDLVRWLTSSVPTGSSRSASEATT
ncbi:hypothetical protein C9J85_16115 [Haloferax sp. wsp5]|nr:hypothetical protein C9J85_16115 [Haloferax sp. wsp5]